MPKYENLLKPLVIKNKTFKNRIMFPPLTTGYEERDGSIGEKSLGFYHRLAKGGTAYIVLGDVTPIMSFSPTPKLFADFQIPTYQKLAEKIHEEGALVGLQIFHPEYDAEALTTLFKEGKMDEARAKLHHDMLHYINEVTKEQLDVILKRVQDCVIRMKKAGIDVVEIHGDRLVGSLCSTIINKRTDEFGGSFENRTRFALSMVKAIKEVCGDMLIEYKLPIITELKDGTFLGKGGLKIDEAVKLAKLLEENGVDMLHVAQANHTGNMNDTIPAMGTRPYTFMLEECKRIKEAVSIPVSIVGRVTTPEIGEALIESGVCDAIGYGRSLLADPDFANKLKEDKPQLIRKCIMCNKGCTDAITGRRIVSCVLNAENGYETTRSIKKANKKYKVAVIGAGVAGLESARVLALKGHDVEVFEKSFKLGGQVNIASVPPRKREMLRCLDYYEATLKDLNINVHYNHEFNELDLKNNYDYVVVATGATNLSLNIKGSTNFNVMSSWDVLSGERLPYGKVLVVGGGLVGVETSEYLAELGYNVEIIEMLDKIAREESSTIMPFIEKSFNEHNVKVHLNSRVKEYQFDGVIVEELDKEGNVIKESKINGDSIVEAVSSKKNHLEFNNLNNTKVVYVGDSVLKEPNTIEHAIKSAYDVCNLIGNEEE